MIAVICVLIIHDFHRHQLCDQGGERAEDTMQPGRTATFLRTTAAKKISTHQFRQVLHLVNPINLIDLVNLVNIVNLINLKNLKKLINRINLIIFYKSYKCFKHLTISGFVISYSNHPLKSPKTSSSMTPYEKTRSQCDDCRASLRILWQRSRCPRA